MNVGCSFVRRSWFLFFFIYFLFFRNMFAGNWFSVACCLSCDLFSLIEDCVRKQNKWHKYNQLNLNYGIKKSEWNRNGTNRIPSEMDWIGQVMSNILKERDRVSTVQTIFLHHFSIPSYCAFYHQSTTHTPFPKN